MKSPYASLEEKRIYALA